MDITTSWSNESLSQLSNRNNHKVVKDTAGEYRWYHKLDGKWSIHSIKIFEDESTPLHWMHTWLSMWSKELDNRLTKEANKIRRSKNRILRSNKMSNKDKAIKLSNLLKDYTQDDIANELNITTRTLRRYISEV